MSSGLQNTMGEGGRAVRKELDLVRRALRARWPMTDAQRQRCIERLQELAESADDRSASTALRTLATMEAQNQVDDLATDKNARLDAGQATERVDGVVLRVAGLEAKD